MLLSWGLTHYHQQKYTEYSCSLPNDRSSGSIQRPLVSKASVTGLSVL